MAACGRVATPSTGGPAATRRARCDLCAVPAGPGRRCGLHFFAGECSRLLAYGYALRAGLPVVGEIEAIGQVACDPGEPYAYRAQALRIRRLFVADNWSHAATTGLLLAFMSLDSRSLGLRPVEQLALATSGFVQRIPSGTAGRTNPHTGCIGNRP